MHLPLSIIAALVHELQQSLVLGVREVLEQLSVSILNEIFVCFGMQLRRECLLIGRGLRDVYLLDLFLACLLLALLSGGLLLPAQLRFLGLLYILGEILPDGSA